MAEDELRATARVLGDAFLDDPVWSAIGPQFRPHRRIANRISFAGILHASGRQGARITVARAGEEICGAGVAFAPGGWPIPQGSAVWELGWLLFAGPIPAWRGIRDDRAMRASHVSHPHMYLWFLGVAPGNQGRGVGRELLADLHAESDVAGVPTYLETATAENVAFYRRDGYERLGEITMPSGPRMWRMERPAYAT